MLKDNCHGCCCNPEGIDDCVKIKDATLVDRKKLPALEEDIQTILKHAHPENVEVPHCYHDKDYIYLPLNKFKDLMM